jgi:hypothetical protein
VTSYIIDSAAIFIMVIKFRNTICPPPPQLSLHRRAAISSNSNGTWSVYSRKYPKAVYIVSVSGIGREREDGKRWRGGDKGGGAVV